MLKATDRGHVAARLLWRVWRDEDHPVDVEIDSVLCQTLARAGSLGLVGRRLSTRTDKVALEAVATWRWQMLHAVAQGRVVARVVTALQSAGVDPVLFKGLASARYYAIPGARPVGDIDLLVSPGDLSRSVTILRELGFRRAWSLHPGCIVLEGPDGVVDLQTGLWPLDNDEAARVIGSDRNFVVEGTSVRVPQRELEVRLLAVHAAKHAFLRPLWLCDVAAAIENSGDLDWELIVAGPWRIRSWVTGTIGLTERLLGLQVPREVHNRCIDAATWVDPSVLQRWGNGKSSVVTDEALVNALISQRSARAAARCIAHGWPDALHVVTQRGWALNRPLAQTAVLLTATVRGLEIVRRLPDAFCRGAT